MEDVKESVLQRKIGYWNWELSKLEERMLKEQSERFDIKDRLVHLHSLEIEGEKDVIHR